MRPETFDRFREFLEKNSGILLGPDKQYLVETRLARLVRANNLASVDALIDQLLRSRDRRLAQEVVDAMTTNETLWFRDGYPFRALEQKFFPEAREKRVNPYRIWSAACSTGQEAFSISMVAEEMNLPFKVEIIGTDISENVVNKARTGVFDDLSLGRGLSAERKRQYFVKHAEGWQLTPAVRRRVRFEVGNLLDINPPVRHYNLIFCRNVLIYFSRETKAKIIDRLANALTLDGYLLLGASESINRLSDRFEAERLPGGGTAYKLKPRPAAR